MGLLAGWLALLPILAGAGRAQWWERQRWTPDVHLGGERPILLNETPADAWRAGDSWTLDLFCGLGAHFSKVMESDSGRFTYRDDDGALPLPRWQLNALRQPEDRPDHRVVAMSACDFRDRLRRGEAVYLSVPVADGLLGDLRGWPVLAPSAHSPPQVFLSGANVGFATHYDATPNTFVQLQGRKEFLFWPPEDALFFHTATAMGPTARQGQLDPLAPPWDPARFPLAGRWRETVRVELRRGDVLFIPPGWVHRVRCLDECVSVSMMADDHSERTKAVYNQHLSRFSRLPLQGAQWARAAGLVGAAAGPAGKLAMQARLAPTFAPQRHRHFCRDPPEADLRLDLDGGWGALTRDFLADQAAAGWPANAVQLTLGGWLEHVAWVALTQMGFDDREAVERSPALMEDCWGWVA